MKLKFVVNQIVTRVNRDTQRHSEICFKEKVNFNATSWILRGGLGSSEGSKISLILLQVCGLCTSSLFSLCCLSMNFKTSFSLKVNRVIVCNLKTLRVLHVQFIFSVLTTTKKTINGKFDAPRN